jgi:hypothetical protein
MDFGNDDDWHKVHKLESAAAMKHLDNFATGAGSDEGRESYYKASGHMAQAATAATHLARGGDRKAPAMMSQFADTVSKAADKHKVEHNAASLDYGSGTHLLAMDAHRHAEDAHRRAADKHYDDPKVRDEHLKAAEQHKQKIVEHGKKGSEISGIAVKAIEKARTLGEHAKTADDHIAAAQAHKEAAGLDYDSEGQAEHKKAAKWHAAQAKKLGEKDQGGTDRKEDPIKSHPNYAEDDHKYLKDKGYTDKQILEIWDRDKTLGKGPTGHSKKEEAVNSLNQSFLGKPPKGKR